MNVNDLLSAIVELGGSDLHIKVGNYPMARVKGVLTPLANYGKLTQDDTISIANALITAEKHRQRFKENYDTDLAYSMPGVGRFRCNIFRQRGSIGLVLRAIPIRVYGIDDLTLPSAIKTICEERTGLILVTGSAGAGKSTTLAAMVDYINSTRAEHILTIEDPIEYLHRDNKSIINQREVDSDCKSFATALRAALRQDPDIILVGEMRDFETIETAINAAETGHLVLSTLHTLDATETVNRIIGAFPPHHQKQMRLQLAGVLKAVISQRLVPTASGMGRVPAVEVMVSTETVKSCIEDKDKTKMLRDVIAGGASQYRMQTFDQSLHFLLSCGLITEEEALKRATNVGEFKLRLDGIISSAESGRSKMENKMSFASSSDHGMGLGSEQAVPKGGPPGDEAKYQTDRPSTQIMLAK